MITKHITLEEITAITVKNQIHTNKTKKKTPNHLLSIDSSIRERERTHVIEIEYNFAAM